MDHEYEVLKARIDALENAVITLGRENPGIQLRLKSLFESQYREAAQKASEPETINMSTVQRYPRAPRNYGAEHAQVDVLRHLAKAFGADI
ncbi:hypothetical protein SB783_05200 [Paraburkholderia sp. SIMBA_009]